MNKCTRSLYGVVLPPFTPCMGDVGSEAEAEDEDDHEEKDEYKEVYA